MPVINYDAKEITCKIVYYGPALSGKTTNLEWIYQRVAPDHRGELLAVATEQDRTLFFDFLPINVGIVSGFRTRFSLYTVPGQVKYESTRQVVLRGADGVVFVADSHEDKLTENVGAMTLLHRHLGEQGLDARTMPLVLQYNKQDLPPSQLLPPNELNRYVNHNGAPWVTSSAKYGAGVAVTLNAITSAVLRTLTGVGEVNGSAVHVA